MESYPAAKIENDPLPQQDLLAAEHQHSNETLSHVVDGLKMAVHGAASWIASKRMERAGKIMERMDHKDALYSDIGARYTSGTRKKLGDRTITETARSKDWEFPDGRDSPETARPLGARPRTLVERIKIDRLEKKRERLQLVRSRRKYHESSLHIYETQDPEYYNDNRGLLEIMPTNPADKSGLKPRALSRARVLGIKTGYLLGGDLSPDEKRRRVNLALANRPPQESKSQRKHRKAEEGAVTELSRAVNQPQLSRWRERRRNKAIGNIKRHHYNAERHRSIQKAIKNGEPYEPGRVSKAARWANEKMDSGLQKLAERTSTGNAPIDRAARRLRQSWSQRGQRGAIGSERVVIIVNGAERTIPARPSQRGTRPTGRARTERGRRYQRQQALNRRGVV